MIPPGPVRSRHAWVQTRGRSLTRFVLAELEQLARRSRSVEHDAEVIRRAELAVGGTVSREDVRTALRGSRSEWTSSMPASWSG